MRGICTIAVTVSALTLAPVARGDAVGECTAAYESTQTARKSGELRRAAAEAERCELLCPGAFRTDCARWRSDLREQIPSVLIVARAPGGAPAQVERLLVDGSVVAWTAGAEVELDPGRHTLHLEGRGLFTGTRLVTLRAGDRGRELELVLRAPAPPRPEPPPVPPSSGRRVAALSLAALGVAALGSFAWFGQSGREQKAAQLEPCKPNCDAGVAEEVQRKFLVADLSLGVGLLSLGAATWLLLSSPPASVEAPRSAAKVSWDLRAAARGAYAGASFSF